MITKYVWIGHSLEFLLQEDQHGVRPLYRDFGRDISILTNPNVNTAFFFLSEQVEELFDIAANICNNLGKTLIIVSEQDYDQTRAEGPNSFLSFKLSKSRNTSAQLRQILTELEEQTQTYNNSKASSRLNKIDTFIDDNINRDIREEEVANLANFSTSYFSKYFRKHKKISFQEYLSNKRVELSKQLLASQPSEKVSSIAFQVGYSDVSYFNRVFKKHTSLTPTEYRQNVVR